MEEAESKKIRSLEQGAESDKMESCRDKSMVLTLGPKSTMAPVEDTGDPAQQRRVLRITVGLSLASRSTEAPPSVTQNISPNFKLHLEEGLEPERQNSLLCAAEPTMPVMWPLALDAMV